MVKRFKLLKSELKESKRVLVVMPIYENVIGLRIYSEDKTKSMSVMVKTSALEKLLKDSQKG